MRGGEPVIYLFPPAPLASATVSLALTPEWHFSALYPVVDVVKADQTKDSKSRVEWTVSAEPDGSLVELASGLELKYLFWEAESTGFVSDHSGRRFHPSKPSLDHTNQVVLPFTPFLSHLDAALSSLALHTSARNDFVTFWMPHFTRIRDKGQHVAFRFLSQREYERAARLDVQPAPDVVTRVFLLFKGVDPEEGELSTTSADLVDWVSVVGVDEAKARDEALFRVLEWGGMEVKWGRRCREERANAAVEDRRGVRESPATFESLQAGLACSAACRGREEAHTRSIAKRSLSRGPSPLAAFERRDEA